MKLDHHVGPIQIGALTALRIVVGWHFLYEGIAKLMTTDWTSQGYLTVSKWIFAPLFHWIAATPPALALVDLLNMWGLVFIGLGLMLGALTRIAAVSGMVLIFLYFLANPPFIGMDFGVVTEGNYLIVDKNLVEFFALAILAIFSNSAYLGLDRYIAYLWGNRGKKRAEKTFEPKLEAASPAPVSVGRRELLMSLTGVPVLGVFTIALLRKIGWESWEEKQLQRWRADAVTSATIKTFNFTSLKDMKGQVPHTRLKNLELSRLILGGNLIGGWAHARDLIYVSKLVKAYHHKNKIFETFLLAEKCGINAFLTNPVLCGVINEYWKRGIGKINFISDCGGKDIFEGIKRSIDNGACACYTHGGITDALARERKVESIAKALELIRQNRLPAGIGAHDLNTVRMCVDYGLQPDFWMKTLHKTNYWSARTDEVVDGQGKMDNLWCSDPDATVEYMSTLKQPWIAYKTLAAGAILPKEGFTYAFENGADFICVGMYDFQIVDDVNTAIEVLNGRLERKREWIV
jgi:uncharacterized membrane protein YphA (DoxX/SURF4 family)